MFEDDSIDVDDQRSASCNVFDVKMARSASTHIPDDSNSVAFEANPSPNESSSDGIGGRVCGRLHGGLWRTVKSEFALIVLLIDFDCLARHLNFEFADRRAFSNDAELYIDYIHGVYNIARMANGPAGVMAYGQK